MAQTSSGSIVNRDRSAPKQPTITRPEIAQPAAMLTLRAGDGLPRLCIDEQTTLAREAVFSGISLHSGENAQLTVSPAPVDSGIAFCFHEDGTDKDDGSANDAKMLSAKWHNVIATRLSTTLGRSCGLRVATVEHLMAAFAGLAIDNAVIHITGSELPSLDGSSAPFAAGLLAAGLCHQNAPRRFIEVLRPISVETERFTASFAPCQESVLECFTDFTARGFGTSHCRFVVSRQNFIDEIAPARTFGFMEDAAQLRQCGFALGSSLDNTVVLENNRVLNAEGLRFCNEMARHKVLDAMGDLYLAGAPILGHYHGWRAGHHANHMLLSALFADDTAWRWRYPDKTLQVEVPEINQPPSCLATA